MTHKVYEGIVEDGKIRLKGEVKLLENAKVYVIMPDLKTDKKKVIQLLLPRLVHREDAARFKMQVTVEKPNARIRRSRKAGSAKGMVSLSDDFDVPPMT